MYVRSPALAMQCLIVNVQMIALHARSKQAHDLLHVTSGASCPKLSCSLLNVIGVKPSLVISPCLLAVEIIEGGGRVTPRVPRAGFLQGAAEVISSTKGAGAQPAGGTLVEEIQLAHEIEPRKACHHDTHCGELRVTRSDHWPSAVT